MEIPGFKVKRTIGRGGMATVYLAVQESLNREVVLKTVNSGIGEQSDFRDRFINEGRIVASLKHPHIVTIYDIGVAGDLLWIAMEFVEGGDLKFRIRRHLSADQALDTLLKIGQALEFAHARGIVHRDVKPANILFRPDGTPLLSDFGIAKQVTTDLELTSTGTILGSPFYMSPEQAEGRVVDGRTDLYSLGVIFYEMLTGDRPYSGDTAVKIIMQHIQSPVPELPEEFDEYQPLLKKLMAKERDARFPDALSLVREVRTIHVRKSQAQLSASSAGTMAHHSVADPKSAKRSRLRLRMVALLASLGLALAGWAGIYVYSESLRTPSVRPVSAEAEGQIRQADAAPTDSGPKVAAADSVDAGIDQHDVVRALEWLAANSLRNDKLMQPPADNAYFYYSRLLELDPDNESAKKGFSEIAEHFVVLAEEEFSSRNYGKAQAYIALGLQVEPHNQGLKDLQSFIENREQSLLETFLNFFKNE